MPSDWWGQQGSCYDVYGWGVVVKMEPVCCVLCVVFFFAKSKMRSSKHSAIEICTIYTYEHSHMPKINSSPVKILQSSQKVLADFAELGLQICLSWIIRTLDIGYQSTHT